MFIGTSPQQQSTMLEKLHTMAYTILCEEARGMLGDRPDVEDIVSSVLLLAASQWEERESKMLARMMSEVRAACKRLLKEEEDLVYMGAGEDVSMAGLSAMSRGSTDDTWCVHFSSLQQALSVPLELVNNVFESLPSQYKRVLQVCVVDGKNAAEAARILKVSRGVMMKRLEAAQHDMKRRLHSKAVLLHYIG